MEDATRYVSTERKALVAGKTITVRNLRPIFKDTEERDYATQKVQAGLYRVFHKYVDMDAG